MPETRTPKPAPGPSTRERILSAAAALCRARGLDAVSVRDIAREVGIREASLYNHFRSKEELLGAMMDYLRSALSNAWFLDRSRPREEEVRRIQAGIRSRGLEAFLVEAHEGWAAAIRERPPYLDVLRVVVSGQFHDGRAREAFRTYLYSDLDEVHSLIFEAAHRVRAVRPDLDPRDLSELYFAGMLLAFVKTFDRDSLEAFSGEVRNHIRAFCAMAGRKAPGSGGARRGKQEGR